MIYKTQFLTRRGWVLRLALTKYLIPFGDNIKPEELRKLRGYHHSLRGQQQIFEEEATKSLNIHRSPMRALKSDIGRIGKNFPRLLPPLR